MKTAKTKINDIIIPDINSSIAYIPSRLIWVLMLLKAI